MKQKKQKLIDRLLEEVLDVNLSENISWVSITRPCYEKLVKEYKSLFQINGSGGCCDLEGYFGVTFRVDELEDGQEFKILTEI